jgi:hypothetical protein
MPSTPFRRRGLAAGRWIPKVKTKSVSFADPLISAVWSPAVVEGPEEEESFYPSGDMKSGDHAAPPHHVVAPSKVFISDHLSSSDALLSFKSLEVADPNPVSTLSAL